VIAKEFCEGPDSRCAVGAEGEDIYLNTAGNPPPSIGLSELFKRDGDSVTSLRNGFLEQIVGGKIVLLGGTFDDSGDFHETPDGRMPGVLIHARAIDAEMHGGGLREIPQPRSFLLDVGWGSAVVLLLMGLKRFGWQAKTARTMILMSSAIAIIIIAVSVATSSRKGYLYSVPAVVLAAVIQQFIDFWRENPKTAEQ
jgi:CHASE2 domain-containing sensor protein